MSGCSVNTFDFALEKLFFPRKIERFKGATGHVLLHGQYGYPCMSSRYVPWQQQSVWYLVNQFIFKSYFHMTLGIVNSQYD